MALSNYSTSASLNTAIAGINIGEGMERDNINDAIRQLMADVAPLGGSVIGTAQSGSTNGIAVSRTFNGSADGTTQLYGQVHRVYAQGSNNIDYARNSYYGTHIDTTAGITANADGLHQYIWVGGAGNVTSATGIASHIRVDGPGDITNEAQCFRAVSTSLGATGSITRIVGYSVGDIGHATQVTDAFGVDVPDLAASSLAIAYRTSINAGANKYAIFSGGTAQSAHLGNFAIGSTTAPTEKLDVTGNVKISGIIKVGGLQVVSNRQTGTAANATDLATAITLVNDLKAKLVAHGLIS